MDLDQDMDRLAHQMASAVFYDSQPQPQLLPVAQPQPAPLQLPQLLDALQQRIQQLEAAQAQVPNGANGVVRSSQLQVRKPELFGGDKDKVETFLFQLELRLNLFNINQDADKIAMAAASLKDAALDYWFQLCNSGQAAAINTWQHFRNALLRRFQVVNPSLSARDEISNLSQTSSVSIYTTKFTAIINRISDMTDADKLGRYIRGLKPFLQRQLRLEQAKKSKTPTPLTLYEAIAMAECLDSAVATPQRSVSYGQKLSQSGSAENSSADSSSPMDLGSMNHRKPDTKKPAVKTSERKFQKLTNNN